MRFINSSNINRRNVNKFKLPIARTKTCLFVSYIVYYVLIFYDHQALALLRPEIKREKEKIWWNYNYFSYFTSQADYYAFYSATKKIYKNPTSAVLIEVYWKRNSDEVQSERKKNLWINTSRLQIIRYLMRYGSN